jgi:hypothetical protein
MTTNDEPSVATRALPARDGERDLEALIRGLSIDFPLHSATELRRTLMDALEDLWPRKDPIDVLDRARVRLQGS